MKLTLYVFLMKIIFSDCPPLDIPHGSISTTVVIKDTVVNITCDTDYTLEGEAQLTCITNGVWDYSVPQCTKGNNFYLFF